MQAEERRVLVRRFAEARVKGRRRRPIIVCGMPRSGTRMIATYLEASPDVVITNEYPVSLLRSALLHEATLIRSLEKKRGTRWMRRFRREYWLEQWVLASRPQVQKKAKTARRIGNKTPGVEAFFEDFELAFAGQEPLYVYCARPPLKVLRSLYNMPWNDKSVRFNWERYKASIRDLARMVEKAPERVLMVRVDALQTRRDYVRLGRTLYRFVGEPITPERIQTFRGLRPAQPLSQVLRDQPTRELTAEDEGLVRSDPFYARLEQLLDGALSPAEAVNGLRVRFSLPALSSTLEASLLRLRLSSLSGEWKSFLGRFT